jgi:transposase
MMAAVGELYLTKGASTGASGKSYSYAYVRYDVWDEAKGRPQPKTLVNLGPTERLDLLKTESFVEMAREYCRKGSSLPLEALRERLRDLEAGFRIICSRDFGLRVVVEQAWKELGYGAAVAGLAADSAKARRLEIAIFAMVLVQVVAPQSKRGAREWAEIALFFPEAKGVSLADLYDAMDVLHANYPTIEARLTATLRAHGAAPTEFAEDSTTTSCRIRYDDEERAEIERERQARGEAVRAAVVNDPPLRMRGHAKDKRFDLPQVKLEAILGDNKIVITHRTIAGNTSDKTLVSDSVARLIELGYQRVRWANDTGYNSVENRNALRAADFEFISAEGVARSNIAKAVLSHPGRYSVHPDKPEVSFKCVRTEATDERKKGKNGAPDTPGPERLYVIRHNADEEKFALCTLERHLEKVREVLAKGPDAAEKLLHSRQRKYVRRDARAKDAKGKPTGPVILNLEAVERARLVAGKSVIASDSLDLLPLGADDLYRGLADIERVFRELKSTIEVGPVRHRRADRIEAHVMIAVMAYNLGAWISRKCGRTLDEVRRLLDNLRVQEVAIGEARYWERTDLEQEQRRLFEKLGFDIPPKRFTTHVDAVSELTSRM